MWVAFAVANVADFALQGASARFAIVVSAILLTITGLAYALALRPRVIAEPSGLTIVNPFRDYHVPWAAIQAVDTGEWVRVHYAPGRNGGSPPGRARRRRPPGQQRGQQGHLMLGAVPLRPDQAPGRPGRAPGSSARRARGYARAAARPRPRGILPRGYRSTVSDMLAVSGHEPGYAENSRLPDEARYLASLPAAKAIAVRLDTRAARERARRDPGIPSDRSRPGGPGRRSRRWHCRRSCC